MVEYAPTLQGDGVNYATGADAVVLSRRLAGDVNDRLQLRMDGRTYTGDGSYAPYFTDDYASWFTAGGVMVPRITSTFTNNAVNMATGILRLVYFRAPATETWATVVAYSGDVAAGATPTLVRFGLYEVADSGDLTLVAEHASTTSLFATTNTRYATNLTTPYAATRAKRLAGGYLVVTGATAPHLVGSSQAADSAGFKTDYSARDPKRVSSLTGQTDLPTSIAVGDLTVTAATPAFCLLTA